VSLLNVNIGKGAFKASDKDYVTDGDIHGYSAGSAKLLGVTAPVQKTSGDGVVNTAVDADPKIRHDVPLDQIPQNL